MNTKITQNPQDKLIAGVDKLVDAVKVTLGPKGQNVIIEREWDIPHITKDGVTVAKSIKLNDSIENMGARLVREAAMKSCEDVGDSTTTTCVLTQAILSRIKDSKNPIKDQRDIMAMIPKIEENLRNQSRAATEQDAYNVACISANNDTEIGAVVAEAYSGNKNRLVSVVAGESVSTTVDIVNGMRIKKGMVSNLFGTNNKLELDKVVIAIFRDKIVQASKIVPLLSAAKNNGNSLLIIAPDYTQEVTNVLLNNHLKGVLSICAIKSPGFNANRQAWLEDIMHITGCQYFFDSVINFNIDELGSAKKAVITLDYCDIIGGDGCPEDRFDEVNKIEVTSANREDITARLANLSGGVAVITVGGNSELEIKEKVDRYDDAVSAVRAAMKGGIVPGGGIALIRAAMSVTEPENIDIINACFEPFMQILRNANIEEEEIAEIVSLIPENPTLGYNLTSEYFEDFFKSGIVDPVEATISALKNAVSIATTLATSKISISLED